MANNQYVNKVVYGNQTVMDISDDTVTVSDVAQGKTFHDATGEQKTGSYVAPTITDITPSNASPIPLAVGNNYEINNNTGYAIESYREVAPSSSEGFSVRPGAIVKNTGLEIGYISVPTHVQPSNSSPVSLDIDAVYKFISSGKAVSSVTDLTPSDSSPALLTRGHIYKMDGGDGYAIESYQSKTPDDTTPPEVFEGEIVKVTNNDGYLYETQPTGVTPSDSNPPQLTANTNYSPMANGYLYGTLQTLSPAFKSNIKLRNNNTNIYSYSAAKRYIIKATLLINTAVTGNDRTTFWYLDKGSLSSAMGAATDNTGSSSSITNSTTNNRLTFKGTNASYTTEFCVIQLD